MGHASLKGPSLRQPNLTKFPTAFLIFPALAPRIPCSFLAETEAYSGKLPEISAHCERRALSSAPKNRVKFPDTREFGASTPCRSPHSQLLIVSCFCGDFWPTVRDLAHAFSHRDSQCARCFARFAWPSLALCRTRRFARCALNERASCHRGRCSSTRDEMRTRLSKRACISDDIKIAGRQ
jgi:hypothetical protein